MSDDVCVSIKLSNHYLIFALVVNRTTNIIFSLVCVYGDPHHRHTRMIWEHISNFVNNNLGKLVSCLGDVNNIMCDVDTTSISVNKYHMCAFYSYVKQCGLFDLGFSGPAYTWTNMRFSSRPIFERLDRCIANGVMSIQIRMSLVCQLFILLVITRLFCSLLIPKFIDLNFILILKIGGLLRKTFKILQKMLGPLRSTDLSMLEPLTLQEV